MTDGLLIATFTLSAAAKHGVERVRELYLARFPDNPPAVASVAWGYVEGSDPLSGKVIVGFYQQSQFAEIEHGIQEVSGVPLIYFTTEQFHPLFDGKVLDYEDGQGFFLRAP
ncbi:MAG TPA: hypothetical protein VHA70_10365 [Bauldia sp.]|nr:hypothetical protein [Bauldia sp.]